MEIIVTDVEGKQLRTLDWYDADFDLAGAKTFMITIPATKYQDVITFGSRVVCLGDEPGGLVGCISTDTQLNTVSVSGYTWRGLMAKKIIRPPTGEDYLTIHAELNEIIRQVTDGMFGGLIRVTSAGTGKVVTWKFDRYVTVYDGIEKMLHKYGYRLGIKYNPGSPGGTGWAEIGAVKAVDYSDQLELSQDSKLYFQMTDDRTGINHVIAGGSGDLAARVIVDVYVQEDGSYGSQPYYTGIDEIAAFYDYAATSDETELRTAAETWLQDYTSKKSFRANVERLGIDVAIGDTLGGRDYITGLTIKKELVNKIVTVNNSTVAVDYIMEGDF